MKKLTILIVLMLALFGCSSNNTQDTPQETTPPSSEKTDDATQDNESHELISVEDMWNVYVSDYEGIEVTEIEFEYKNSSPVYKFEGYLDGKEYEVKYNGFTKEVIEEDIDDSSKPLHTLSKEDLKHVYELITDSEKDVPEGYKVDEWKLEAKSDMIKFNIEYENHEGGEIEFKYNATTKKLIKKSND